MAFPLSEAREKGWGDGLHVRNMTARPPTQMVVDKTRSATLQEANDVVRAYLEDPGCILNPRSEEQLRELSRALESYPEEIDNHVSELGGGDDASNVPETNVSPTANKDKKSDRKKKESVVAASLDSGQKRKPPPQTPLEASGGKSSTKKKKKK